MLVHVQTVTQTTFAWVDENGNFVETRVVASVVPTLTQDAFDRALVDISAAREQLKQEFAKGSG